MSGPSLGTEVFVLDSLSMSSCSVDLVRVVAALNPWCPVSRKLNLSPNMSTR